MSAVFGAASASARAAGKAAAALHTPMAAKARSAVSGGLAAQAKGEPWAVVLSGTIDRVKTVLGVLPPSV